MRNKGTYTLSLGNFCRWLAAQAEELGVEIFPGFPAAEILFNDDGSVRGVATGDMGIARDGSHRPDYQPGMELHARYTFFAEGARGSLTKRLTELFGLRDESGPQVFGLGIKELWDIPAEKHKPGRVIHTQGWPLGRVGRRVPLPPGEQPGRARLRRRARLCQPLPLAVRGDAAVEDPSGDPRRDRGRAARVLWRAGDQRGRLSGDSEAGVPRRRADRLLGRVRERAADQGHAHGDEVGDAGRRSGVRGHLAPTARATCSRPIRAALHKSWVAKELKTVRNAQPAVAHWGGTFGTLYAGLDLWLNHLGIGVPWTLKHKPDNTTLRRKEQAAPIDYPKPDGVLTFDRLSSVFVSNTNHEEDQPVHLTLKDADIPTAINLPVYAGPEQRYCPAGVYEFVESENGEPRLQINAQNCVHCKTCDIKDPTQNINWVTPEGGGGPNYPNM